MKAVYFDKDVPRFVVAKALKKFWRGVVWTPISPTGLEERDDPPLPGTNWLRVRNRQCGVCTTDLTLFFLNADPRVSLAPLPGFHRVYLGHEAVGEVVEVGAAVKRFEVGDRAVIVARPNGSPNCYTQDINPRCRFCAQGDTRLCENASLRMGPQGIGSGWADTYTAHESEIWPVPDDLTDDQASLIEPMAVAVHGVLRKMPGAGDKVLVIGAGIIGLLTLQALKAISPESHVTIVVRYSHQGEAADRLGADEVISDSGDIYAKAARITKAKYYQATLNRGMVLGGFDVIYDCVGDHFTLRDSLRLARAHGTVVMVGTSLDILKFDTSPIYYQEVDLIGSNTFGMEVLNGRKLHTFDLAIEMLQEGALKADGLITHRIPFEDYRKAIKIAADKRQGSIKVTLTF